MYRGVWVGALALGLGGVLADLTAQQPVWRPVSRPAATARGVSQSPGAAFMGRPVPLQRHTVPATSSIPRPFPPAYRTSQPVVSETRTPTPGIEPIASVPPPGAIIAASNPALVKPAAPLPAEPLEDPGNPDLFAVDRVASRRGPVTPALAVTPAQAEFSVMPAAPPPLPASGAQPPGNWTTSWPAFGPPEVPPLPAEIPYGADQPPPRFFATAEYLLWWAKRDRVPVLASTGDPQNGVNAGRLGNPDTVVLFDGALDRDPRSGGRFTLGYYLDDCGGKALEVTGFFLGSTSDRFAVSSAQLPGGVLARPFFSLNEGIERVEFVARPGQASGRLTIDAPSEFWGLEANLRCRACCGCDWRVDVLGGFRFLSLRESISITEDVQTVPGLPDPFNNVRVLVTDRFATTNEFYGGQVGVAGRWQRGRWTVDGQVKVALGMTHQEVSIDGIQIFPPGTPNVNPAPGGLLALNSNIGTFSRDRFAVVPEVGITLGYYLTPQLRATIGYNFLYWSSVVRPGDQIDRNLDVTRIPNFALQRPQQPLATPHPQVLFKGTDFWAQGMTFGLEFKY